MRKIFTISILLTLSALTSAQSIFDISLKDVGTGEGVLLENYQASKGIVVVFMSTSCPYTKYYESRLQDVSKAYKSEGLSFVMINANSTESVSKMKNQANDLKLTYLSDNTKELANFLGAKKSPEVFLLDSSGKVYYSGAIDDNPQVADDVRINYLKQAIDGLLEGKPRSQSTNRPVGCMIK